VACQDCSLPYTRSGQVQSAMPLSGQSSWSTGHDERFLIETKLSAASLDLARVSEDHGVRAAAVM